MNANATFATLCATCHMLSEEARSWHPTPHFTLGLFDRYYSTTSALGVHRPSAINPTREDVGGGRTYIQLPSTGDHDLRMSVSKAINIVAWACM
jgi:hypothetical protein